MFRTFIQKQSNTKIFRSFSTTTGPLDGVIVVALEQAVAAPFCTAKLADDGARVIKIERKGGDFARHYDTYANGECSYFTWLNRGKESIVLDVKNDADRALLKRIITKADVFVQNLAPGAAQRIGFDSKSLMEMNEQLITLDISGYGNSGPKQNYKAYDLLVAAETGLCSVTGTMDGPGRVGISICDIVTGMNGYEAILKGLIQRGKTGKGNAHMVSLFDSISELMNVPYLQAKSTGEPPLRMGLNHPSIAPYGGFKSKDGHVILIAIQNQSEWERFCTKVLNRPELLSDKQFKSNKERIENRQVVDEVVASTFQKFNAEQLKKLLLKNAIAFGQLNSVQELIHHTQLRTIPYETTKGMIPVISPAVRSFYNGLEFRPQTKVPDIGEHTDSIKQEFQ